MTGSLAEATIQSADQRPVATITRRCDRCHGRPFDLRGERAFGFKRESYVRSSTAAVHRLNPLQQGGTMKRLFSVLVTAALLCVPQARASSHREALAILNEPCADNT